MKYNSSRNALSFITRQPCITSLWPPKYFVEECITMSAPRSSGFCKYGDAKVLSTQTVILCCLASFVTAAISTMFIKGLVGVLNANNHNLYALQVKIAHT